MIPDDSILLEYAPNAPCVADRHILFDGNTTEALKRMLSRLGLSPMAIGFRSGEQEALLVGRDHAGNVVTFARVIWGATVEALDEARRELIAADWQPQPPKFEARLPDGRDA